MEIFHAIEQSASYYSTPGDSLGYGIPNFQMADVILGGTILNLPVNDQLSGLYPNPFKDELYFTFNSTCIQNLEVNLFDMRGACVEKTSMNVNTGSGNELSLHLNPGLASGIYLLKVKSKENTFFRKVICR